MADMIELARQYGSYGYRRVAALLRDAGWQVSDGRVERLWKREGLKVPPKQPKKARLWLNAGSTSPKQGVLHSRGAHPDLVVPPMWMLHQH